MGKEEGHNSERQTNHPEPNNSPSFDGAKEQPSQVVEGALQTVEQFDHSACKEQNFIEKGLAGLQGYFKEAAVKTGRWVVDFLSDPELGGVDFIKFGKGFAQAFVDKGENIGEFFAQLYLAPKETLKLLFDDAKRLISYVATKPEEAARLGWNLAGAAYDDKLRDWDQHPEKSSYDIGYVTGMALIICVLFKGPKALGLTKNPSLLAAEAASLGIFVSSNGPNVVVSIKDLSRTRQTFEAKISRYVKKNIVSTKPELKEAVDRIVHFSFDELEKTADFTKRNQLWLALIDFFHGRETGEEPDFENVMLVQNLFIKTFYDIKGSVFRDDHEAFQFFKNVFASLNVSTRRPPFEKGELSQYREKASDLWNEYMHESVLAESGLTAMHADAAFTSMMHGKIPQKANDAAAVATLAVKFPYYLRRRVPDNTERDKLLYALQIEWRDSDLALMADFASGAL